MALARLHRGWYPGVVATRQRLVTLPGYHFIILCRPTPATPRDAPRHPVLYWDVHPYPGGHLLGCPSPPGSANSRTRDVHPYPGDLSPGCPPPPSSYWDVHPYPGGHLLGCLSPPGSANVRTRDVRTRPGYLYWAVHRYLGNTRM
jgi:hypothetical protein